MNNKSKILIVPAPIQSHIIPSLYLGELLSTSFIPVFAITDFGEYKSLVQNNGFETVSQSGIKCLVNFEGRYIIQKKHKKLTFIRLINCIRKNELFKLRRQEFYNILRDTNPQAVILDIYNSTDYFVLKSIAPSLNILFFNPMLSVHKIEGFPEVSDGEWEISGSSIENNLFKSGKKRGKLDLEFTKAYILNYFLLKQRKEILKTSGIKADNVDFSNKYTLVFKNVPELILAPEELEFSKEVRLPWQYYLGLCLQKHRKIEGFNSDFTYRWEEILRRKKKIVYCSFGTYYSGTNKVLYEFVTKLVAVFEQMPDVELIVAVNRFIRETMVANMLMPKNINFFSYVPQLLILERSDLFITHGGLGSIKEAIFYKVPMLVYPISKQYDPTGNGLKVEYHKIGLRGEFESEKLNDMKNKIDQLLGEPMFKDRIGEFHHRVQCNYSKQNNVETLISLIL